MLARCALIACVLFVGGCSRPDDVPADRVFVRLGPHCLHVPHYNARFVNASAVLPGTGSNSGGGGALLRFDRNQIEQDVPGVRALQLLSVAQDLVVLVYVPTSTEMHRVKHNAEFFGPDLWYGLGEYQQRQVVPISGTELFRIYPIPRASTWMVTTARPDEVRRDTHLRQDFWIASCSDVSVKVSKRTRCTTSVALDRHNLLIQIQMTEEALLLRQAIGEHMARQIEGWKRPCSS